MKNKLLLGWMIFLFSLLIGFLVWGVFYVTDLKFKIPVLGIGGIIVTAFTSVFIVGINNTEAKRREYDFHVLKEKQKVCEHFYNSYFEILKGTNKGKNGLSNKATQEMMEFKKGLMNWGSDRLIKKYLAFDAKLIESQGEQSKFNIIKDGNDFVKELRKELGFNDSKDVNIMSIILTAEARKELKESGVI